LISADPGHCHGWPRTGSCEKVLVKCPEMCFICTPSVAKSTESVAKCWYTLLVISIFPWLLLLDRVAYVSKIMAGHVVSDMV